MREFTLQFSKRTFDWFVVTQPTIKTEDGYTTRVIEISALETLRAENQRLRDYLISIAKNSCCDQCQQAKLVALKALSESEASNKTKGEV